MVSPTTSKSNFPEGFPGFQARIEALTEALGGTEAVRTIIEEQFNKSLREVISTRLYGNTWSGRRYSGLWTAATNADFENGYESASRYFRERQEAVQQTWKSVTLNADVVLLEGNTLYLRGVEHDAFLAYAEADSYAAARIHPAQQTRRDPWRVSILEFGETILKAIDRRPDKAAVTVQGSTGAQKTLIRFAELFL